MTALQTNNTVSTAQIISGLPYDGSGEQSYHAFKHSVKANLEYCKRALVVNVVAFGIATQTKSIEILKEVFGFKEVHNSHNYKYPGDSKRLICLIKDMNDYTSADLSNKVTNTFATNNEQAPRPSIWDERTRDPEALRSVALENEVIIRRLRSRYNTKLINGEFVLNDEVVKNDPFPINRWVEIPNDVTQVPLLDKMQRVSMVYHSTRGGALHTWTGFLTNRRLRNVIEEYQLAGLRILAINRRDDYKQD